jgi:glycosyltransferase involved in cell wall biosynthesis
MSDGAGHAPRVSVLMTVYNAEAFLAESIDSILAQTFQDWELIAVDDGSKDGSRAILARYTDPRVRVVALDRNIGRTPALRVAFDHARGEYIAVLDADDLCTPDRFTRQAAFLDAHPGVALVASWVRYIDEQGKAFGELRPPVEGQALLDRFGFENPIVHSSVMYRRALAGEVGGYSTDLAYAQDFGLVLALAERHPIAVIDEFLCSWRIVSTSMTRAPQYAVRRGRESVMNFERAARLPLGAQSRRLNRRARAIAKVEMGLALIHAQSRVAGAGWIARGLLSDPLLLWTNGIKRLF